MGCLYKIPRALLDTLLTSRSFLVSIVIVGYYYINVYFYVHAFTLKHNYHTPHEVILVTTTANNDNKVIITGVHTLIYCT